MTEYLNAFNMWGLFRLTSYYYKYDLSYMRVYSDTLTHKHVRQSYVFVLMTIFEYRLI